MPFALAHGDQPARSGDAFIFIPDRKTCKVAELESLIFNLRHQTNSNWQLVLASRDPVTCQQIEHFAKSERRLVRIPLPPKPAGQDDHDGFPDYSPVAGEANLLLLDPMGAATSLPADSIISFVGVTEQLCPWWAEVAHAVMELNGRDNIATRASLAALKATLRLDQLARSALAAHPEKGVFGFRQQLIPSVIAGMKRSADLSAPIEKAFSTRIVATADARWVIDSPTTWDLASPVISIRGWCLANDLRPPSMLIWTFPSGKRVTVTPNEARGDVIRSLRAPDTSVMCGFCFVASVLVERGYVTLEAELRSGKRVTLGEIPFSVRASPANWVGAWLELGKHWDTCSKPADYRDTVTTFRSAEVLSRNKCNPDSLPASKLAVELDALFTAAEGDWVVILDSSVSVYREPPAERLVTVAADVAICFPIQLYGARPDALLQGVSVPAPLLASLADAIGQFEPCESHLPPSHACAIRVCAWKSTGGFRQLRGSTWAELLASLADRLARKGWKFSARPEWLTIPVVGKEERPDTSYYSGGSQDFLTPWREHLWRNWQMPRYAAGSVLQVLHNQGGGTTRHVHDLAMKLEAENTPVLIARPTVATPGNAVIWSPLFGDQASGVKCFASGGTLATMIREFNIRHIHLHHTLGWPEEWLAALPTVTAQLGITYDVTAHDYSSFCPRINLLDHRYRYCGEPDASACERCIQQNGSPYGAINLGHWRTIHARLLEHARRRFAPNVDAAERLARHFPHLQFECRPHWEQPGPVERVSALRQPGEVLRVVVLGAISPAKGSFVLSQLALDATLRRLPIQYTVLGYTDGESSKELSMLSNVVVVGRYHEQDVHRLLGLLRPHLAFFPAVWPETYSYTLSIALQARIYPVVFDLGAQAARLRQAGWGRTLPLELADQPAELNDLLLALAAEPAPETLDVGDARYGSLLADYYHLPDLLPN